MPASHKKPKPKKLHTKQFTNHGKKPARITGDEGFTGATTVMMASDHYDWDVDNSTLHVVSDQELTVSVTPNRHSYGKGEPWGTDTEDVTVTVINPDGKSSFTESNVLIDY